MIEQNPQNALDLSVIVVNYNTRDVLENCQDSLYRSTQTIRFEVLVVDNASSDDSVAMIQKKYSKIKLIHNATNAGFARANNQGIRQSRARYVLLLNPDTVVFDGTVEEMVRFMDRNRETGMLGCKIQKPDGTIQTSTFSFPSPMKEFFRIISLDKIAVRSAFIRKHASSIFKELFASYGDYDASREVNCVCGACLMVRRKAIEKVGYLDEHFFMYHEEREWCYRFKKQGWKIYYIPHVQIRHLRSGSDILNLNRKLFLEYYRGILYFVRKHHAHYEQRWLKWMIIIGCVIRIYAERIHKRAMPQTKQKIDDTISKYSDVLELAKRT